ncbi:MAG: DUF2784 family protein [Phenylobacterium sp.]|uniref:DUF2784 domain-containing protein n=1 Tax=Phenylobacterium sp. TaxID=1871053 RepID=UPI0012260D18|nr:DUF2784 domain-containing protein [Phenylobacterium sp.]TAJ72706.1 MAG: DUF2784 family protein [Phenylobacterium sp.]
MNLLLGQFVLAVHLAVIAFNVAGLGLIPLGAWRGWRWVRIRWLRVLHLASLAVVAVQAMAGRACFLTDWQDVLTGAGAHDPLIMRWVNGLVYWPLPPWVFAAAYVAVFAYAAALWRWAPPERRHRD